MTFEEFYSDITSDMEQYYNAGLIDKISIYNWLISGINEISILPTIRIESIISIKNNKGKLPDGFKSLYSAVKCEPFVCKIEDDSQKDILTDIYHYKVRELKNEDWNFCNPCEIEQTETCVVEKVYFHNNTRANFYYNNLKPIKLILRPFVKKTICDKDCVNFSVHDSPFEISINRKTLYTNFKNGNVFIIYNGYEEDDEGYIIIPETEENNLEKYLKNYVSREIIRKILLNSDNTTNENFLYQMYDSETNKYQSKAVGEYKIKKVLNNINNYTKKIKREFEVYDFGKFSYNERNRIEFLVT